MIAPLAIAVTLVALVGGLAAAGTAVAGTFRWARFAPMLATVEVALLVQAVTDAIALARGHRPGEPSTHLAYLVTSVLVVPAAASQTRGDDGRWAGLLVAVALIVVAVLVVRLATTWRTAGS